MNIEHKNVLGIFPDRQHIELALDRLRSIGFPMNKVAVIVEHSHSESTTFEKLTEPLMQSEARFDRHRIVDRIEHGALGTIVGSLVAGLSTLAFPAVGGAVLLIGIITGGFYGAASGGLLGNAISAGISEPQVKHYSDLLTQGYYLISIEGTHHEIEQAESVLQNTNIQDWIIFNSLGKA